MVPEINWLAVLLAAISSMVVGAIWYAKSRKPIDLSGSSDAAPKAPAAAGPPA